MLYQLDVFVEVARTGSVRRAADALAITQPTATWRLQTLEREIGVSLFVRANRRMWLSDAGRLLLPTAQRIVHMNQDLRQIAVDFARGQAGRLEIAASPSVGAYFLPDVLKRFRDIHPQVDVAVRTDHSEEVLRMVRDGGVHLGVARDINHPDVVRTLICEEEICLVASPAHPLARLSRAHARDCADVPFVVYERATTFEEIIRQVFAPHEIRPRVTMEMDTVEGIKHMVGRGLGIACIPYLSAASALAAGTLVRLELVDAPRVTRKIVALRRKTSPGSEAEASLLALLQAFGASTRTSHAASSATSGGPLAVKHSARARTTLRSPSGHR